MSVEMHDVSQEQKSRMLTMMLDKQRTSLIQRTSEALTEQNLEYQRNMESIVGLALEEGAQSSPLTEILKSSWGRTFLDHAKKIYDDEKDPLKDYYWANILRFQLASPGAFHIRTLDVFAQMSSEDVKLLEEISPYCSVSGDIIYCNHDFPISRSKSLYLSEMGILHPYGGWPSVSWCFKIRKSSATKFEYHNGCLSIKMKKGKDDKDKDKYALPYESIYTHELTTAGRQLLSLFPKELDLKYLDKVKKHYKGCQFRFVKDNLN
ncbi:MAG: DUF2806 domain-containing protein [Zetaproteobacteria bacterium]|nr:DUF2806 domain-containing protein [Zetaproteobacteria bacterium]